MSPIRYVRQRHPAFLIQALFRSWKRNIKSRKYLHIVLRLQLLGLWLQETN